MNRLIRLVAKELAQSADCESISDLINTSPKDLPNALGRHKKILLAKIEQATTQLKAQIAELEAVKAEIEEE